MSPLNATRAHVLSSPCSRPQRLLAPRPHTMGESPQIPAWNLSLPNPPPWDLKKPQSPGLPKELASQGGRKVPEGQQVSPDVEGLIGHLEKAEEAGGGGTLWVSVAEDDALLVEHLQGGRERGTEGR